MSTGHDLHVSTHGSGPESIVLAHGFAQNSLCWGGLLPVLAEHFTVHAVDLPGHGRSEDPAEDLWDAARRMMESVHAKTPARDRAGSDVTLVGYSMGARVCLHAALLYPGRVRRLVLVSGTAGIEDGAERAERASADETLAETIRTGGVHSFLDAWLAGPLMATLPADARFRAERELNSAEGLARSLETCGTGTQTPLWSRLDNLTMPVCVIAGELDRKFLTLGERLVAGAPDAELITVAQAGHSAHLENPHDFALALSRWLDGTTAR